MSQKVEETLNRINTHQGVLGVLIVDKNGVAIKTTMSQEQTILYGSLIMNFKNKADAAIKRIDKDENIAFIRIRSREHEIMIAPDSAGEFTMIVIQDDPSKVVDDK